LRMLYNASLLTESINNWYTPTFSPLSDRYRKSDQSLTYYVETHWLSPVISSAYGISLERRILKVCDDGVLLKWQTF
jgi:hypothetical protein